MFVCAERCTATSCLIVGQHPASVRVTACLHRDVTSCPGARDILPSRLARHPASCPSCCPVASWPTRSLKEARTDDQERPESLPNTQRSGSQNTQTPETCGREPSQRAA